jgi:hypothetical protein
MKNLNTILITLFALFIVYWLIFVITPDTKMAAQTFAKIDSLNNNIDSLQKKQIKLDSAIIEYTIMVSNIDTNIEKIKNQKTIIKEYYHEKIIDVSNYNTNQLDSFFAERYGLHP